MIKQFHENRKKIAILFALFLVVSIIFLGIIGNTVMELEEEINEAEKAHAQAIEEYTQTSMQILNSYNNVIKYGWEMSLQHFQHLDNDRFIQAFIDNVIIPENMASDYFIFIVYNRGEERELIYKGYEDEKYGELELPDKSTNNIQSGNFENGDKFYYLTNNLEHEDISLQVHVGYLESVAEESYIKTIELDNLIMLRNYAENILLLISAFMLSITLIGVYSLYKSLKLINADLTMSDYWNMYVLSEFIQSDEGLKRYLNSVLRDSDMPRVEILLDRMKEIIDEGGQECDE